MLLLFFGIHAWSEVERKRGVATFTEAQQSITAYNPVQSFHRSEEMRQPQDSSVVQPEADGVLAILRVEAIGLELPVRYGTEERVLRRGPGLVEGTSLPGSNGNVGIAAHRDIHFRGLKDLAIGDLIELEIRGGIQLYVITDLSVVEPTDVHVLDETGQSMVTLVTCYPFTFVGNAPKRFIVRAEASESMHLNQ